MLLDLEKKYASRRFDSYCATESVGYSIQKLQNCIKAAIAFVCTTCKKQLLFALLQLITFVCTTAIENISTTTPIVNFCMPYCNC